MGQELLDILYCKDTPLYWYIGLFKRSILYLSFLLWLLLTSAVFTPYCMFKKSCPILYRYFLIHYQSKGVGRDAMCLNPPPYFTVLICWRNKCPDHKRPGHNGPGHKRPCHKRPGHKRPKGTCFNSSFIKPETN